MKSFAQRLELAISKSPKSYLYLIFLDMNDLTADDMNFIRKIGSLENVDIRYSPLRSPTMPASFSVSVPPYQEVKVVETFNGVGKPDPKPNPIIDDFNRV